MQSRVYVALNCGVCVLGGTTLLAGSTVFAILPGISGAVAIALSAACSSAGLALFACGGALMRRGSLRENLGLVPGRAGTASSLAFVAGTLGLSHLLERSLRAAQWWKGSTLEHIEQAFVDASAPELLVAAVGIAVAPGIAEELLFRGLLLRALARWGTVLAVVVSGLAFGALHLDPAQGGAAALLGVYLGLVALASGSVLVPILCHIANNLVALGTATVEQSRLDSTGLLAAGAAAAALGLTIAVQQMRRRPAADPQRAPSRPTRDT